MWYWHNDKLIGQRNRMEIVLHIYDQLIFDQGTKALQWGKGTSFKTNIARKIGYLYKKYT